MSLGKKLFLESKSIPPKAGSSQIPTQFGKTLKLDMERSMTGVKGECRK